MPAYPLAHVRIGVHVPWAPIPQGPPPHKHACPLAQLHARAAPQSGDISVMLHALAGHAGAGVQHSSPFRHCFGAVHSSHAILFDVMQVSWMDAHVPVGTPLQVGGVQHMPTVPFGGAAPPAPTHS